MFKLLAAVAAAGALAVASVLPASATTVRPTVYTRSYAGYYLPGKFIGGPVAANVVLPALEPLAPVTSGVTAEFRLASPAGAINLQFGTNPQNNDVYASKVEASGFTASVRSQAAACNVTPQFADPGTTQAWYIAIRQYGYNGDDTVVQWWDNNAFLCEIDFSNVPTFTRESFVSAFNVKTFKAPASPVRLGSFSQVSVYQYPPGTATGGKPISYWPHGKDIATSTGTGTGVKRAVPSALNSTGDGFTVTLP